MPQVSRNHDLNTLAPSSPCSGGTSSPRESGWWGQLHMCVEWIPGLGCCRWHMLHRYVPSPHMDALECGSNVVLGEAPTTHRWGSLLRDVGEIGSSTHTLPLGQGGNPRLLAGCWRNPWRLVSVYCTVSWSLYYLQKSASTRLKHLIYWDGLRRTPTSTFFK